MECGFHLGVEIRLEEKGDAEPLAAQVVHDPVHRRSQVIVRPACSRRNILAAG